MAASIRLRGVSKQFRVSHEKPALARELLPRLIHPLRVERHWALRDIDLEIEPGSSVGVIGPNGSGKTTLLSVIAGITQPTTGTVRVGGNVATLLSLGSGFHPELTGLENIFLNGTLLGMTTREIRKKLDAIVAFSQLDGFLDAPLQTYSAGMQLRLGFAVAVHTEFDVLVIDEVMSVGDAAFQAQCLNKLLAFTRAGKTLLMAAQSGEAFRALVDRALLLHQGRIIADGSVDHVQERYAVLTHWLAPVHEPLSYMARMFLQEQVERHNPSRVQREWGQRHGTGEAIIKEVLFIDREGHMVDGVNSGDPLTVALRFTAISPLVDSHIGVAIFRDDGSYCYGPNTRMDGLQFQTLEPGPYECRWHIQAMSLTPGSYRLSVAVWDPLEQAPHAIHAGRYPLEVRGATVLGLIMLDHVWHCHVPADTGTDANSLQLLVEGPHGRQAWYRTFEPLTLTMTLPAPREPEALTLRAECRGPRDELWWVSRWSPPPHAPSSSDQLERYQLSFPRLPLLTGWYRWSIGWETADGARRADVRTTCTVEVIADRLDHGIIRLPHHWELVSCHAESLPVPATLRS